RIESDQKEEEEPFQTDYPTPSRIVGETSPPISLALPEVPNEVIDVRGDNYMVTPDVDDDDEQDAEVEDEEEGEFDEDELSTEDEDNDEVNLHTSSSDDD
ncbi:hypothetical protein PIB30_094570, partial [Stylosanthes scabra]|nr:hypothetical protein [Stylosanthes scabra]